MEPNQHVQATLDAHLNCKFGLRGMRGTNPHHVVDRSALVLLSALGMLILVVAVPRYESISEFPVEVTWVIDSTNATARSISFAGRSFVVPVGGVIVTRQTLVGGMNGNILWRSRGWRIGQEPILVDGYEVARTRLSLSPSGTLSILGIGRKPRLRIEIRM